MKINKIIIQNLNSIENAEIDFTKGSLSNEPLFLICGETGTGKTTILDAITLALYDKSPRYENFLNKEKASDGNAANSTNNILRKGTFDGKAEVWLSVGNDTYVAVWQMHKTRNNRFDDKNRRRLDVVHGDERIVVQDKINNVNEALEQLIGLTYEQFVRSVMLAQGQFSKFLTSEKSKQTEILEMLTGTEIYSKIADAVRKRRLEAVTERDNADVLYKSVKDSVLSDEETKSLSNEMENLLKSIELKNNDLKKIETSLEWLRKSDFLKKEVEKAKLLYNNALNELDSESAKDDAKLLSDYLATTEVRAKLKELNKLKKDISSIEKSVSIDISELNKKKSLLADSANEDETTKSLVELLDFQEELNKKNVQLIQRKDKIERVKQVLEQYLSYKQSYEEETSKLNELSKIIDNQYNAVALAKADFEKCDAEFQNQKAMIEDWAKEYRQKLKDGEPCPVCGSTEHPYKDAHLVDSLIERFEKKWNESKKNLQRLTDDYNKTKTQIEVHKKNGERLEKQYNKKQAELVEITGNKPVYEVERLTEAINNYDKSIKEQNVVLERLKKLISLRSEIDNLKTKYDEHKKTLNNLDSERERTNSIINAYLVDFENKITIERLEELNSRNDIQKIDAKVQRIKENVTTSRTAYNIKCADLENHNKLETRPVDDETVENLSFKYDNIKKENAADLEKVSEMRTKLSVNSDNKEKSVKFLADYQRKSEVLTLWEQLSKAIGTTEKENFRDVAQAYTMKILLEQANYYLKQISRRYELFCYTDSLAIMVRDLDMGGEERAASSLSGGETFLVSLALALGLASLNDRNFDIDMLFIDEGFGTLDGDSLDLVMTALENLNQIGRRVGIISHVEVLKERIPAQIRLVRKGKSASVVEIV